MLVCVHSQMNYFFSLCKKMKTQQTKNTKFSSENVRNHFANYRQRHLDKKLSETEIKKQLWEKNDDDDDDIVCDDDNDNDDDNTNNDDNNDGYDYNDGNNDDNNDTSDKNKNNDKNICDDNNNHNNDCNNDNNNHNDGDNNASINLNWEISHRLKMKSFVKVALGRFAAGLNWSRCDFWGC